MYIGRVADIDDETVAALAGALTRVSRRLERARRQLSVAGRLALLQVIAGRQPVRPSDIGAELDIHQSLASRKVQALATDELVRIERSASDRRATLVSLTAAGRRELNRLNSTGIGRFREFVTGWSADEVAQLTALLERFEQGTARYGRLSGDRAQADVDSHEH